MRIILAVHDQPAGITVLPDGTLLVTENFRNTTG
ncbi:PQQ-dependent sugar dehydrogenase [Adhaeribacter arboris]|nr:PQQ-dependent sugar dehydrogenase [Adhaeribacter arboris]